MNQAALFFFNKWLEKYRGYSNYPSDRLDVDVGIARGLYRDYLENNNTASLNRAVDIMSKGTARFYNRYIETNAWRDDWHREAELGEFLRTFIELRDKLPAEIHERTLVITRKVANHFSNINKVRNRYQGNTAAEENAWIAMFLAIAANLYPDEPNSANWEKFARTFAYHTITTSGDGPYGGIKTQTVHDDFVMDNTGYHPNCIYPIWTLNYLGRAAAAYFGNKKAVPSEFRHNTTALWNKTKTFINLGGDRWVGSYGDTSQAADWPPSWLLPCFWPWIYLVVKTDPHYGDELLDWRYKNKPHLEQWAGESLGYALHRTLREYAEAIIAGEYPTASPTTPPTAPPPVAPVGEWRGYGMNLLKNPGAETGTPAGVPTGWYYSGMWCWPNSVSRGNYALAGYNGLMYQDVGVSKYSAEVSTGALKTKAGAWGKKAGAAAGQQFRVELQFIGSDGSGNWDSGWVNGTDRLVYQGTERVVPAKTTAIRLRISVRGGFEPSFCFLDDCSLQLATKVEEALPVEEPPIEEPVVEIPIEEPVVEIPIEEPVVEIPILDRLSQFQDFITPTGSPVQESEIKRQAMIMELERLVKEPIADFDITEEPLTLAEAEPVKEKILSLDWLKKNWLWVGVGIVSLGLVITIAKD